MCLDAEGQIWLADASRPRVPARRRRRRGRRRGRRRARPRSRASWEATRARTLFVDDAPRRSDRFEVADLWTAKSRRSPSSVAGCRYDLAEFGKGAAQVANRLMRSHLVLDQRETNVCRLRPSPKPTPGLVATSASAISNVENSSEDISRYGSGIGAQTNIDPRGRTTSQPMRCSPSMRVSRRDW